MFCNVLVPVSKDTLFGAVLKGHVTNTHLRECPHKTTMSLMIAQMLKMDASAVYDAEA